MEQQVLLLQSRPDEKKKIQTIVPSRTNNKKPWKTTSTTTNKQKKPQLNAKRSFQIWIHAIYPSTAVTGGLYRILNAATLTWYARAMDRGRKRTVVPVWFSTLSLEAAKRRARARRSALPTTQPPLIEVMWKYGGFKKTETELFNIVMQVVSGSFLTSQKGNHNDKTSSEYSETQILFSKCHTLSPPPPKKKLWLFLFLMSHSPVDMFNHSWRCRRSTKTETRFIGASHPPTGSPMGLPTFSSSSSSSSSSVSFRRQIWHSPRPNTMKETVDFRCSHFPSYGHFV